MHKLPQLTLEDYESRFADRHLVHGIVAKWSREKPDELAIINADRGTELNWASFDAATSALARSLQALGLRKGDFVATSLPLTIEHIVLEFGCFKAGVIVAPLDLRLAPAEVIRCINVIGAKAFVFLGKSPLADCRELGRAVRKNCASVEQFVQFSPPEELIEGAIAFAELLALADERLVDDAEEKQVLRLRAARAQNTGAEKATRHSAQDDNACEGIDTTHSPQDDTSVQHQSSSGEENGFENISEHDGALVIFTTGSTGSPKPALLSHRNITSQCMCISQAFFDGDSGARTLVNLPASHVGCQTELMMGTLFGGGTAVILETFDAARSLRAMQEHKVNKIGQIPALFNFEWRLRDYENYDLSSLDFAAYGGQQVSPAFIRKMATMAPRIATGLGLTECAGFCTYILEDSTAAADADADILKSLGVAMPVYPFTVRAQMHEDGSAGAELAAGEIGHVCFSGPQTFLGYINDPEATARTLSSDGWLYTGDLGFRDERDQMHLTGRAKWVIKSFGYQIFPADVENHIALLEDQVASCAVVGAEHAIISEGIMAFVEKKPGAELTQQELDRHARGLSAYMRPRHWVLLEPGQMPLTRTVKPDYMRLSEMAREEITKLRASGKWDKAAVEPAPAKPAE